MATTERARAAVARKTDPDAAEASTEVATTEQPRRTLAQFIQILQPEIARALPRHMDGDRMARLALTVVRQSEMEYAKGNSRGSLAQCSPDSFAGALLTAAALGLEPGVNGEAYLVPYKGECTLIIGYQGYAKLFYQHPLARNLDARAVHANDEFDYAYGTSQFLKHRPALGERGEVIAYYAVASLSTGASAFVVLTPDEVKAIRGGKVGPQGKIADPQRWMERKTALRQLVKLLPKSASLAAALAVDEQGGTALAVERVPESIAEQAPVPQLPATPGQPGDEVTPEAQVELDEADRRAQAEWAAAQEGPSDPAFALTGDEDA